MRIGVNSGSLPKHLHELERTNPVEALAQAAVEFVELMERLEFENFKVSIKSTSVPQHDRRQPAARLEDRVPDPPRDHRGGDEVVGIAEVGRRSGDPARRRRRRHDPDQPLHLPRRGGGEGGLGDPQGARPARARPGADRLPNLRPPPVRHGHGGGRDRAAARAVHRADRGRGARLRGERDRRGLARRLRDHRRQERGPDLRPRQAAAKGPAGRARRRPVRGDRQVPRPRRDRRRRLQGGRGRRLASEDRGRERRRADPGADRPDGGRGRQGEGHGHHRRAAS